MEWSSEPLNEHLRRRPDWRAGSPVLLGNGEYWGMPRFDEAELEAVMQTFLQGDVGPEVQRVTRVLSFMLEMDEASGWLARWAGASAAGFHLLSWNYEVGGCGPLLFPFNPYHSRRWMQVVRRMEQGDTSIGAMADAVCELCGPFCEWSRRYHWLRNSVGHVFYRSAN